MRSIVFVIGMLAAFAAQVFSQSHIPPCSGPGNHSTSICYGYATGRAAGNFAGDANCDPMTLHLDGISPDYFTFTSGSSLTGLLPGDIVAFSGHVAYVSQVRSPMDSTLLDQVPGVNGNEEKNKRLSAIKYSWGNPTGYWRRTPVNVTVQNDFGGASAGDVNVNTENKASGTTLSLNWWTFNTFAAINGQRYGGYGWKHFQWTGPDNYSSNNLSISIKHRRNTTYTAHFYRVFDVTFQNNFIGVGNGGTIKVKGQNQNSPYTAQVNEGNSVTAQALPQTLSNIDYSFDHWSDGSTSAQKTFTPVGNTTYTAHFIGKPVHVTITSSSGPVGTNIRIVWAEHPNLNVSQYQVWRKVKHLGQWQGPTLLATLDRGTTSFTDDEYIYTSGYTDDLLNYDIRAYYSTEGTYADANWVTAYGELYRQLPIKDRATSLPSSGRVLKKTVMGWPVGFILLGWWLNP